jgi:MshEN domain
MTSSMQLDVYKEWLGIPEGDRPPDHYTLLRLVKFEDDDQKIRRNYSKLNGHVRKYATGQYSKESQALLNELAKAMLCLTDPQRKREYDASIGRVEDKKPEVVERQTLGQVLVAEGNISDNQRKEAEKFAEARGLSMRDAVVQMKLVDTETATKAFAQELGYSYVDLADTISDDSVLDKVPRNLVKRHAILPLFVDDDTLIVACVHEPTPDLEEELRLRYGVPIRPVLATPLAINQAVTKYYAPGMRDEAVVEDAAKPKEKSGKTRKEKPAKTAARKDKAAARLSPEEAKKQMLIGVLIILWTFGGCALIDAFLLMPIFRFSLVKGYTLTLFIPPIVAVWAYFKYLKAFFRK